jgi:nucleoside-diphosphate-sugar epimerase
VYGNQDGPVSEAAGVQPLSPYALSKLAMEDLARLYTRTFHLETVCLRFFNVYGPRQDPGSPYAAVIPLFLEALLAGRAPTIYGDGRQSRDFVFVDDVVKSMLLSDQAQNASGETFNIGFGESATILALAETLRRLLPGSPEPVFAPARVGDIRASAADIGRATQVLGYRPACDLTRVCRRR